MGERIEGLTVTHHKGAVDPEIISRSCNMIEIALREIAERAGLALPDLYRLTSAWAGACAFVDDAVEAVLPHVRVALQASEWGLDFDEPVGASLFVSSGFGPNGTHGHQDLSYRWNGDPGSRYAFTTWVPFDNCGRDMAGIAFSRGFSGREVTVRQDFLKPDFRDVATTDAWLESEVVLSAQPGDIVVFDSLTWHASAPIRGSGMRRALAIRWASSCRWEHEVEIPRPDIDATQFGMDTSGQHFTSAVEALGGPSSGGSALQFAAWLIGHSRRLSADAELCLRDLATSLTLFERYGARPAAHVWRAVRERLIPEMWAVAHAESKEGQ